jgi:hypothetical protein
MKEGLLKRKKGKMSLQIIKTFSYEGSWSVNLNSKIHFPALNVLKSVFSFTLAQLSLTPPSLLCLVLSFDIIKELGHGEHYDDLKA